MEFKIQKSMSCEYASGPDLESSESMAKPGPFTAVVAVDGAKRAAASPRKLAVLRAVVAGELCKSAGDPADALSCFEPAVSLAR